MSELSADSHLDGADAACTNLTASHRVLFITARVLSASAMASWAAALIQSPWSHVPSVVLTIPLLAVVAMGWAVAFEPILQGVRVRRKDHASRFLPLFAGAFSSAVVVFVGFVLSNVLLIDEPASGDTLVGYAITLGLASITAVIFHRALRGAAGRALLRSVSFRWLLAASLGAVGVGLMVVDAVFLPLLYDAHHLLLALFGLGTLVGAAHVLLADRRWSQRICGFVLSASVLALVLPTSLFFLPETLLKQRVDRITDHWTIHRRAVLTFWYLTDRDGDGFSSVLAGGDCDDGDPDAYPLSLVGTDCLGWVQPDPPSAPPLPAQRIVEKPAELIVLITIDAFRCGFGRQERSELLDVCPALTNLSNESDLRIVAHTPCPSTVCAIPHMHRVSPQGSEQHFVGDRLRELGYRTFAVITHPALLRNEALRSSLDVVDTELQKYGRDPHAVTSDRTTDRALTMLAGEYGEGERAFLWVHYFDPHAPYVHTPGSRWAGSTLESYREEVKRTDVAAARLIREVRSRYPNTTKAILVTADHGQAFGEHGERRHGMMLFETTARVPLLLWRSPEARTPSIVLPSTTRGLGGLLAALAGDPAPAFPDAVFMVAGGLENPTHGVVHDGWKLIVEHRPVRVRLFNLHTDSDELLDLSMAEKEKVKSLGKLLSHNLLQEAVSASGTFAASNRMRLESSQMRSVCMDERTVGLGQGFALQVKRKRHAHIGASDVRASMDRRFVCSCRYRMPKSSGFHAHAVPFLVAKCESPARGTKIGP